jgi:pyruvate,water dikinase
LGLLRLLRAGASVPPGFCVTAAASRWALNAMLRGAPSLDPSAVTAWVAAQPLPPQLADAIAAAYDAHCAPAPHAVAVRSSACGEDGAQGSHAGLYASALDVAGLAPLWDALKAVWLSALAPRLHLYRHRAPRHDAPPPPAVAVVVQRMIRPQAAGVLFTDEPLSHGAWGGRVVISAAPGLGEVVVQGGDAQTFYLPKRHHHDPYPDDPTACLSLAQRRSLWAVAAQVEAAVGGGAPQDVEFAFEADTQRLWLLQARPIVRAVRAAFTGQPAGEVVYTNANVGEALPGVGTPMTWSLARGFARRGFEGAFGALGLTVPPGYRLFASYLGRVYLNLTEFVAVASQLPLLTVGTLAQLSGAHPAQARRAKAGAERLGVGGFMRRLPLTIPRALASQAAMPWVGRRWVRRLKAARRALKAQDLTQPSDAALRQTLGWVDGLFEGVGEVMLGCSANLMGSFAVAGVALRWLLGDAPGRARLIAWMGALREVESAAPGLALRDLARWVASQPAPLRDALASLDLRDGAHDRWRQAFGGVAGGAALLAQLDALLDRWGHRAAREADLITPRWEEDPTPLLIALRHLVTARTAEASPRPQAPATDQDRRTPQDMGAMARALLGWSRHYARLREALRGEVVGALGMYRRLLLEVGRRMVARGDAAQPDDVFFLTIGEARQWLEGADGARGALRWVIASRRAEYAALCAAPSPPDDLTFDWSRGRALPPDTPDTPPATASDLRGAPLQGLPGSAGVATGPARLMSDVAQGDALRAGEVLVVPFADVGWTPLFLVAAAVVTERGGPLSHACVVGREYGVPMVVSVPGVMARVRDSDRVTVDGATGRLWVHATP